MAGPYSAGTIFLQVVPSYRDFQNQLRKDAPAIADALNKELDKELEKGNRERAKNLIDPKGARESGEKAGEEAAKGYGGSFEKQLRASMRNASERLPAIKVDADTAQAQAELEALRKRMTKLGDVKIGVDMDAGKALTEVASIEAALKKLQRQSTDIDFFVNSAEALTEIEAVQKALYSKFKKPIPIQLEPEIQGSFEKRLKARVKAAQDSLGPIRITASATAAEQTIRDVQMRLREISDARIGIDIDAGQALTEIAALEAALASLPGDMNIQAEADVQAAMAELATVGLEAKRIDRLRPTVNVNARGAAAAVAELKTVEEESKKTERGLGNTANAFRAFNGYLLAGAALGPLLVPVLAAITGGLLALGPAAIGAGTGLGILIAGFSGLGTALTALRNVQKNQAKDALAASKTNRAAARGLADAQRSLEAARRGVGDAERSAAEGVASALRQQEDAERSLARAQRDAQRAQEDLVQARIQAAKDIADLNAQVRSGKLDERQGVIDVFNATVANSAAQKDPGATNLEKEQAAIDLERARIALENTRRANKDLAAQKAKVDREGVNGTQRVQDAQDRVTAALEAQQEAVRRLGEASAQVDRARADGARQVEDANRRVADAVQRLADAQQAQRDAIEKTGEVGSASMLTLRDEMAKLGPAGQHFVYFLADLQDQLYKFRDAIQQGMLPGVEDALSALMNRYGVGFTKFLQDMGSTLGDIFRQTAEVLQGPAFSAFFDMMAKYAPTFTQQMADIGLNLAEAFANIMTAMAPFSKDFGDALVRLSEDFKTWTANLADNEEFKAFLAYARKEGPRVMRFIGALLDAVLKIAEALAPYADTLLNIFTGFLEWIAGMDPKVLGAMVLGIIGLIVAVQTVAGVVSAVVSTMSALSIIMGLTASATAALVGEMIVAALPFIAIAAVVALVVVGLIILYKKSETFRNIVNAAFRAVGDAAVWMWENAIKPAVNGIVAGWEWLTSNISRQWNTRVKPVFELFGAILGALWKDVIKPTLGWIGDRFSDLGKAIRSVWDKYIAPVFDWFMDKIGNKLVAAFETGIGLIGGYWNSLIDLAKKPVKFVVDTVINGGIIDPFNKLADFFHTDHIAPIKLPKGFDRGGWTGPGSKYTPAGIVHADEFVVKKESRRRFEQRFPGYLDYVNATGTLPGYAQGGQVGGGSSHPYGGMAALIGFARMLQQMGFKVTENPLFGGVHPVHAKNSLHYSGNAIDVNWAPGTSKAEQAEIDKLIPLARAWGLRTIWRVKDHFNHAHFDTGAGADLLGNGTGGTFDRLASFLHGLNPVDWFRDKVDALPKMVLDKFGDNGFTRLLVEIPKTIAQAAKDKIYELAASVGDFLKHGVASGDDGSGTAIGQMVQREAGLYGWGKGAQWDALRTLISQESSWNPLAKNPSSTAYGLFQFLDSTWGSVGGYRTSDPMKQAEFGLKYIKQRYGDPVRALEFHDKAGWYAEGGRVTADGSDAPTLYDTGGILPPGITNIMNASGKPEAILTNEQFLNLERIANGAGSGLHIDARSYGSDLRANDVAEEIIWAVDRMSLGGRYASLGAGIGAPTG